MFKKSHRKYFAGFAILLSLVFLAVACGGSATSTPQPVAATAIPAPVAATAIPEPATGATVPEPVAPAPAEPVVATTKRFEGETMVMAAYAGVFLDTIKSVMGKKFEEDTGGKIDFVPVYGDFVSLIASAPADRPPYDMTTCFGPDVLRGTAEGIFLPLRRENIPNAEDIGEWHLQTSGAGFEGIDHTYALPFEYIIGVIGYNKETVPFEITSYADLWRPEAQGLIGLDTTYYMNATAPAAMILDGQPGMDEIYTNEGMDVVIEKMLELDVALWWDVAAQATAAMERGDISIIIHAAEQISTLVRRNPDKFAMVVAEEGSPGALDYLCTIRGTKHRDMAEAFMNYMLDPVLQSEWAEEVPYWMSNTKTIYGPNAKRIIPDSIEERNAIFLNQDWGRIIETWDEFDERLRKELYTK